MKMCKLLLVEKSVIIDIMFSKEREQIFKLTCWLALHAVKLIDLRSITSDF